MKIVNNANVVRPSGLLNRRLATRVSDPRIRAIPHQHLHNLNMAIRGRIMKRCAECKRPLQLVARGVVGEHDVVDVGPASSLENVVEDVEAVVRHASGGVVDEVPALCRTARVEEQLDHVEWRMLEGDGEGREAGLACGVRVRAVSEEP